MVELSLQHCACATEEVESSFTFATSSATNCIACHPQKIMLRAELQGKCNRGL